MILAYCGVMLRLVFHLYDAIRFRTGWDLAIFDQATWLISRGEAPFASVRGLHILADHFSVILYPLAPLYWVWDSPKVLLLAQTVTLSLGALPTFALARHRLGSPWWGLTFALAYLLYPMLQWANSYEFHPDTLSVPLLLWALLLLRREKWRGYFACLIGAALTKENVGLTIAALGVWVAWRVHRRVGFQTIGVGIVCLAVALGTVRYFNNGAASGYYLLYEKYGSDPPGLVGGVLQKPHLVWADASSEAGRKYLGDLGQPLMYLSLLSPGVLLAALPSILTNLLSSRSIMHTLNGGYYSSLAIPFIFAAAIESCRGLRPVLGAWGMRILGFNLLLWLLMGALSGAAWKQNRDLAAQFPSEVLARQQKARSLKTMLARVPGRTSVAAQIGLTPYLGHRQKLFTFPNPFVQRGWGNTLKARREMEFFGGWKKTPLTLQADVDRAPVQYVALQREAKTFPLPRANFEQAALAVIKSRSYGIVFIDGHGILFRRGTSRRVGWQMLAKAANARVSNEKQMEAAFWKWLAL